MPEKSSHSGGEATVAPARRLDIRLVAFSLCLVVAVTLVLARVLPPGETAPPIPPLAENTGIVTEVPPPTATEAQGQVVGTMAPIEHDNSAETYTAAPPIDNDARQRLLSILSKD